MFKVFSLETKLERKMLEEGRGEKVRQKDTGLIKCNHMKHFKINRPRTYNELKLWQTTKKDWELPRWVSARDAWRP